MEYLTLHDLPHRNMYNPRRMATPEELRGSDRTLPALPAVRSFSSSSSCSSPRRKRALLAGTCRSPVMATPRSAPTSPGRTFSSRASSPRAPSRVANNPFSFSMFQERDSGESPAEFMKPPSGLSTEHALPHLFSRANITSTVDTAAEERSGSVSKLRSDRMMLPPPNDSRDKRLDASTSSRRSTLSVATDLSQNNHSNEDAPQNHLARHSPPVQPNEQQPSNVGLPSFSQVKLPVQPL
jgi:hypothetical protein